MWLSIDGFSDYVVNSNGMVHRISTGETFTGKNISLKSDNGLWKNRSIDKLVREKFGYNTAKIIATPLRPDSKPLKFENVKEAAQYLSRTNQAITAGRFAAYQTVRTNIMHSITQPELYPFFYGYVWKIQE